MVTDNVDLDIEAIASDGERAIASAASTHARMGSSSAHLTITRVSPRL